MKLGLLEFFILGTAASLGGVLYRRFRGRRLPVMSDSEFVEAFTVRYKLYPSTVLTERRRIARILGVAPEKLFPQSKFEDLARRFEYFGAFGVGWSNLEDEAEELRREAGIEGTWGPLDSIEEYIAFVIEAKERIAKRSSELAST